jgi:hypothetical protein
MYTYETRSPAPPRREWAQCRGKFAREHGLVLGAARSTSPGLPYDDRARARQHHTPTLGRAKRNRTTTRWKTSGGQRPRDRGHRRPAHLGHGHLVQRVASECSIIRARPGIAPQPAARSRLRDLQRRLRAGHRHSAETRLVLDRTRVSWAAEFENPPRRHTQPRAEQRPRARRQPVRPLPRDRALRPGQTAALSGGQRRQVVFRGSATSSCASTSPRHPLRVGIASSSGTPRRRASRAGGHTAATSTRARHQSGRRHLDTNRARAVPRAKPPAGRQQPTTGHPHPTPASLTACPSSPLTQDADIQRPASNELGGLHQR